ncbi:saccharopine dehydrogenase [Streptomyces sp. NPDC101490]|uniref:saccharopine dehydrogenase n=1 Tax=Streptomyces sp. NPDC101490 TaxID=3366143 RepID=UPI00381C762A
MRHETRPTEHRASLSPRDACRLVGHGVGITVEDSPQRVFPLAEYVAAGCSTAPPGSWVTDCPVEHYVLGLKELPPTPSRLLHRHILFGHAYRGQPGARALLRRFADGGGALLDLECLVDDEGRRIAAFGHWAGYAGAALAVLHHRGVLAAPLARSTRAELDRRLCPPRRPGDVSALVIGAGGRCGLGACEALRTAGIEPTRWTSADTEMPDRSAVLAHDILVNAIGTGVPVPPFLTEDDLDDPGRRLSVVCDVTCDVGTDRNALPVYDHVTDWDRPVDRLRTRPRPLDLIAIDNLPSLLAAEASRAYSAALWPHLLDLGGEESAVWDRCRLAYRSALDAAGHR